MKRNTRLDTALVDRGYFLSAEEAGAYIMSGEVSVNGQIVYRRDRAVAPEDVIELKPKFQFVSRGAYKLQNAFEKFNIRAAGKKAVDIGISNGGFSDLLLQKGAAKVLGIDVNIKQVDYKLQTDSRISLLKKNARYLVPEDIGFEPDLFTIDVSFISVIKILEALSAFGPVDIVALIKPQFEVSRQASEKGGVIRNPGKRIDVLLDVKHKTEERGFSVLDFASSGIQGRKGNYEYFFYLKHGQNGSIDDKIIKNEINV